MTLEEIIADLRNDIQDPWPSTLTAAADLLEQQRDQVDALTGLLKRVEANCRITGQNMGGNERQAEQRLRDLRDYIRKEMK